MLLSGVERLVKLAFDSSREAWGRREGRGEGLKGGQQ